MNQQTLHFVNHVRMYPPFPDEFRIALFALGCFWGAERSFWQIPGVYVTAVGYGGGHLQDPDYKAVCTGSTGHAEMVFLVFDPGKIDYTVLLQHFWTCHNPTQGMRQGNDVGSQYRSGIYTFGSEQNKLAESSRDYYQEKIYQADLGKITTEIISAPSFYYAEEYHQQYLAKNPSGYCSLRGTGVSF